MLRQQIAQQRQSVLVTGAARGLGRELAFAFAAGGYDIIIHDRNPKGLNRTYDAVIKKGVICWKVTGDLRNSRTIKKLSDFAKAKKIIVLINNAGILCPYLPLSKISDQKILELLAVNLIAPIRLTQKVYAYFKRRGYGTIININSLSGLRFHRWRTLYCASKWGLRGFSQSLRLEIEEPAIRVMEVYPSRIKTRAQFRRGMPAADVAAKIFHAFAYTKKDTLVINGRLQREPAKL